MQDIAKLPSEIYRRPVVRKCDADNFKGENFSMTFIFFSAFSFVVKINTILKFKNKSMDSRRDYIIYTGNLRDIWNKNTNYASSIFSFSKLFSTHQYFLVCKKWYRDDLIESILYYYYFLLMQNIITSFANRRKIDHLSILTQIYYSLYTLVYRKSNIYIVIYVIKIIIYRR